MERSESEEIKRIDEITKEISPTFCFAKWYHANIYFQTGETHSCYHPAPHKIDTAPLLENPSAIHNTAQKKKERAALNPTSHAFLILFNVAQELSSIASR